MLTVRNSIITPSDFEPSSPKKFDTSVERDMTSLVKARSVLISYISNATKKRQHQALFNPNSKNFKRFVHACCVPVCTCHVCHGCILYVFSFAPNVISSLDPLPRSQTHTWLYHLPTPGSLAIRQLEWR